MNLIFQTWLHTIRFSRDNILPETLILQLHLEVPSTTCFSDDSRLSMCVSGFTLNTVLRSDKRAHIETQFICLHTIHPPDLYVCTSYMQWCTATALVELVCYDSPGFELSLDNIAHLPGANIGQQWQILISKLRHTIGRQQHWRQRYSASIRQRVTPLRFQPLTMIFANHLLVPSKTIDLVDSMNVLCSPDLNSKVSLGIFL